MSENCLKQKMSIDTIPFYRYYLDIFLDFLFRLIYRPKRNDCLPKIENPLLRDSASSLARRIRQKELRSEEVVRAFIERSKVINRSLNAIVDERYALALQESQVVDDRIDNGKLTEEYFEAHPLLGVPFTVSESLACEGLSWTLGLLSRKDLKAKRDARAVNLMKEAGAILIAVTNVPQLGLWTETYNPVYGFTRNPYDSNYSVGGSSGGEASIVAACGSPLGIGTDVGGCIRIPANRCGVFAHKCTGKLISVEGNPLIVNVENSIAVVGPIVKYAEDLSLVLRVLLAENVSRIGLAEKVNSTQIQFFYSLRSACGFSSPIRYEVEENMKEIVKIIGFYHAETKPLAVEVEDTTNSVAVWGYQLSEENLNIKLLTANDQNAVNPLKEVFRYVCGKRDYCLYTLYNLFNLVAQKPGRQNEQKIRQSLNALKETFLDILEGNSVLLFPTEPLPLAFPYESLLRPYNNSYSALWNALYFPVTQVPIGLRNGHPYGVQIIAAPYKDHLCIAAAEALETLFGSYVEPEGCYCHG